MRILAIIILVLVAISAKTQSLQFYREDISFIVKDGYFHVDGQYNFCNNGDTEIRKTLFYPYPEDISIEEIDSVFALENNITNSSVLSGNGDKGAYFNVTIGPYGVKSYNVGYRQKISGNKVEYILLSTKKWGTPFDNAYYKMTIPQEFNIESFSYEPDSLVSNGTNKIYYWTKKDFMPDKNFIVEFR